MKFSEIKPKIKNLGSPKTLKEIKKAGLRVVRNTKTGDYWLIEEEFLRPVVKSPREIKGLVVGEKSLRYKVLVCSKSRKELRSKRILKYIEWGEQSERSSGGGEIRAYHKRPTTSSRGSWWDIGDLTFPDAIWMKAFNDTFKTPITERKFIVSDRFYEVEFYDKSLGSFQIGAALNHTAQILQIDANGRINLGEGALDNMAYEAANNFIVDPNLLQVDELAVINREVKDIFEECGIDPSKPIREQEPNPLPDRKALDDVVFDALGLTKEERKKVYWAVCELVQNRLQKAKSV